MVIMIIIVFMISFIIINIETTSQETSISLPVKRSDDSLELPPAKREKLNEQNGKYILYLYLHF